MTESAQPLGPPEAPVDGSDGGLEGSAGGVEGPAGITGRREWALDGAPYWPVTRLVSWSLTLLLVLEFLVPSAISRSRTIDWLILLPPSIVATFSARGVFETLGVAVGARGAAWRVAAAAAAALVAIAIVFGVDEIIGWGESGLAAGGSAALILGTLVSAGSVRELEIRLRMSLRRVYFVGSAESRRDLERELSRRLDARLVGAGVVATHPSSAGLVEAVLAAGATVVVLDGEAMRVPELVDAAATLNLSGVRVGDLVSYYESEFKKVPLGELSSTWFLFDIASIHNQRLYRSARRAVDVGVAVVLLVVTLPFLVAAGIMIRLTSPGAALYRQRRVGKDGAVFVLLKLRTMIDGEDQAAAWAAADEHRVTPFGAFLRRFRLDEIPQLWNVIRGDLALIGPRPEQVPIAEQLQKEIAHYAARHCIRPGITGWAQVNLGYAGSIEGTVAKLQRDLYYVKHSGARLDALIVWLTIKAILVGPDLPQPRS
jgi:lipopolysaccharide/colanic/teichoic acid biosynthesis glycosyltransferase